MKVLSTDLDYTTLKLLDNIGHKDVKSYSIDFFGGEYPPEDVVKGVEYTYDRDKPVASFIVEPFQAAWFIDIKKMILFKDDKLWVYYEITSEEQFLQKLNNLKVVKDYDEK